MATKQEKLEAKVNDARKQTVETIIEMMETKGLQWFCEWDSGAFMPKNGESKRAYHGGNRMHLMARAVACGYEDSRWFTFNQAKKLGYFPRKGERSALIEYWKSISFAKEVENEDGETEVQRRSFLKLCGCFHVFNAEQLENEDGEPMKPELVVVPELDGHLVEVADRLIGTSRCKVVERKTIVQAAYSPLTDRIKMPSRLNFSSMEGFLTTLTHEMTHSTMVPLNRKAGFGRTDYAKEELVAELGSTFACLDLGVHRTAELEGDENFENHAAYLESWLGALRNDYDELFKAAALADKAAGYIMDCYNGEDERMAA